MTSLTQTELEQDMLAIAEQQEVWGRTAETPKRHGSHVRSGFDGTLSGSGATHGTAGRGTGIDVRIASCDCSSRCCSDLGIESKIETESTMKSSRDWGRPWTLLRLCSFTFREWLDEQIWKLTKLKNLISQKMMRIWNILGLVLKAFVFFCDSFTCQKDFLRTISIHPADGEVQSPGAV